jgi:membrane dipeptidase
MNFPVFDLHCDTALALLGHGQQPERSLRKNDCHIDLERAGKLAGFCQCFACFTTPFMQDWMKVSPVTVFEKEMEILHKALEENADVIRQAFFADDVEENLKNGMMSAVFTLEGTAGIHYDPARLEEMYAKGFRITSLGWNEQNPLTGSHVTGGGLTDRGREYVKEAQRLGMIVDVSHISDEGFWDIMDVTQAPIIATHSNSRAVCGHSRNLTDEMFLEICKTGGVAGFNQCAPFVGEKPDLDTVCDHILHFLEIDPEGKHIALGGDLDGCDELPAGFVGVESYNALADRLLERGLDEKTIRNIYWNNTMGVMDRAVRNHQR